MISGKIWAIVLLLSVAAVAGCSRQEPQKTAAPAAPTAANSAEQLAAGAALFKQYCSSCHPDGGNVSDPARTLHGAALRANHITTPEDIIRIMRHPLSRMIRFDTATLSDRDARAIAEYVLYAFK